MGEVALLHGDLFAALSGRIDVGHAAQLFDDLRAGGDVDGRAGGVDEMLGPDADRHLVAGCRHLTGSSPRYGRAEIGEAHGGRTGPDPDDLYRRGSAARRAMNRQLKMLSGLS